MAGIRGENGRGEARLARCRKYFEIMRMVE
jgi:hypothetical protein